MAWREIALKSRFHNLLAPLEFCRCVTCSDHYLAKTLRILKKLKLLFWEKNSCRWKKNTTIGIKRTKSGSTRKSTCLFWFYIPSKALARDKHFSSFRFDVFRKLRGNILIIKICDSRAWNCYFCACFLSELYNLSVKKQNNGSSKLNRIMEVNNLRW